MWYSVTIWQVQLTISGSQSEAFCQLMSTLYIADRQMWDQQVQQQVKTVLGIITICLPLATKNVEYI